MVLQKREGWTIGFGGSGWLIKLDDSGQPRLVQVRASREIRGDVRRKSLQ
jgi:hypothetical protein